MKTEFKLAFQVPGKQSFKSLYKKVDLPFPPAVGMDITEYNWSKSRKVLSVELCLTGEPLLCANLDPLSYTDLQEAAGAHDFFKQSGWCEIDA